MKNGVGKFLTFVGAKLKNPLRKDIVLYIYSEPISVAACAEG
jgi:hypothetical protein